MPEILSIADWIENHEHTVDLFKWIFLIFLGWVTGFFSFLRELTNKPRVRISETASRCFIEEIADHQGTKNCVRASLLLCIEVANRRREKIVVNSFTAQVRQKPLLRPWGPPIASISLPNRVQFGMGAGMKIMRNWFSNFADGIDHLTVDGKIEPHDAQSGFVLFVSFTHGWANPKVKDEKLKVLVQVELATGEQFKTSTEVIVTHDKEFFEKLVPNIYDQISHPTAWNTPARF